MSSPIGRAAVVAAFMFAAPLAAQDRIEVPSGQEITLQDVIQNVPGPEGLTIRFRFIAPAIATGMDFDAVAVDMAHLCETYVLPRLSSIGPQPSQVIVSLAERAVDFGDSDPDVAQLFEAYRPEDGHCVLEAI